MLELLVALLILLVIVVVVHEIIGALELPPRIQKVVYLVMAVFVLIVLLYWFGLVPLNFAPRRVAAV